jgi:hypothetical protein
MRRWSCFDISSMCLGGITPACCPHGWGSLRLDFKAGVGIHVTGPLHLNIASSAFKGSIVWSKITGEGHKEEAAGSEQWGGPRVRKTKEMRDSGYRS